MKLSRIKAIFDKLSDIVLSPLALDIEAYADRYGEVFSEITSSIYLGARPDTTSVTELKEAGITHVVSCLDKDKQSGVSFLKQDFEHLFLGIRDSMNEDISTAFPAFFEFTTKLAQHHSDAKLLVHCESGVSRSAALVIAQLMMQENRRFFDVFKQVKSKRSQILPNIGFASQLQQLENELLSEAQIKPPSSLALYLHQVCNFPADLDVIQSAMKQNEYDAVAAARYVFGGEIPRVIQGAKP